MDDDFFITFSSSDAQFEKFFSGTYYLPYEILLDTQYEVALDAFFSSNLFENDTFLTINCDLFPYSLLNGKVIRSCYILYNKNVNEQIYKNHYYVLQKSHIQSINISITNLNYKNILFNSNDFCVFKFHFQRIK